MLEVSGLTAGYGERPVLRSIDLTVGPGDVVAVLGANGAGKSTLLRTLAGLIPAMAGSVRLDGSPMDELPPHRRSAAGLVLVPEGHQAFAAMTVEENLLIGGSARGRGRVPEAAFEATYTLFPRLAERRHQAAGTLSGGERQMLAIARALMAKPRVLMLDEPSHGLAPVVVEQVAVSIREIARTTPTLVAEQNLTIPALCATTAMVIEASAIVLSGEPREVLSSPQVAGAYLGT